MTEFETLPKSPAHKRAKRRPGRPSLSNEELLDTALNLFMEKGFDRTSIDAITAAAGMAKRTVYARYGDKTNLFKAALTRAIENWMVPVERLRAAETADIEETLCAIGRILINNLLSPAGLRLLRLTNAESMRMPEISVFTVQRGTDPTLSYLQDLFKRRFSEPGQELPFLAGAAHVFLNMVVGGPANNAAWGLMIAPKEVDMHVRYSVRLFLYGMLADKNGAHDGADGRVTRLLGEAAAQLEQARSLVDQASQLTRD